ncbi:MAG: ribosome biogenesis GTPase Der [Patescibacteria group bacterium]|jgi:GTP-binding protein
MSNSSTTPIVAIVGRTNVGKSTLFNRLTETDKAIISPIENTTRDQNRGKIHWKGYMCEVIDTGGLDTATQDSLGAAIKDQVQKAIQVADVILFVVDGKTDLMPQDKQISQLLRNTKKPIVLCINKIERHNTSAVALANYAKLPYSGITCSAKNGSGTAELLDTLFELLPKIASITSQTNSILLTLVGRPNVGKSSLFNALIGEDRVIVNEQAHTTRDINDTEIIYKDQPFTILDTAGIRKHSNMGKATDFVIEKRSVRAALDSITKADIVILLLEAQLRVSAQDKTLVDYANRKGKSVIIAINKWDLVPDKTPSTINAYRKYFAHNINFADHLPIIFISAQQKQRITQILDEAINVYKNRFRTIPQDTLNDILFRIQERGPKQKQVITFGQTKKPLLLKSLDQSNVNPPTFRLVTTNPKNVAPAIINQLERDLRYTCNFEGVPIMINVRNS